MAVDSIFWFMCDKKKKKISKSSLVETFDYNMSTKWNKNFWSWKLQRREVLTENL